MSGKQVLFILPVGLNLTLALPMERVYTCKPVSLHWNYITPVLTSSSSINPTMMLSFNQFLSHLDIDDAISGALVPLPGWGDVSERRLIQTLSISISADNGPGGFLWKKVDVLSGEYFLAGGTISNPDTHVFHCED